MGIGMGAAAAVIRPTAASAQALTVPPRISRTGRFSRMFDLPPFAEASPQIEHALMELGVSGGLMDAKDPLQEGPVRLITNAELDPTNLDNLSLTAGTTFLGQFLDHDMTFDGTSKLGVPTRPEQSINTRTPAFDLDSVYGGGPTTTPLLYDSNDRAKFKVESGGLFEDLPRRTDGTAIIADPRNDENLMIAGLQCAFLLFHNRVVDRLRADGGDFRFPPFDGYRLLVDAQPPRPSRVFEEARRLVTWHYQRIILHEFLPKIIGQRLVTDIFTNGRRYYVARPGKQTIPVEFQAAAYRFGHSMVRPSYRANLAGDLGQPFFGFIFDPAGEGQADPVDLRGGARAL